MRSGCAAVSRTPTAASRTTATGPGPAPSTGRSTARAASPGAGTTTAGTGRGTRSPTGSRDVAPVAVEILAAEPVPDPRGARVSYAIRNDGDRPVWVVDDGWLT